MTVTATGGPRGERETGTTTLTTAETIPLRRVGPSRELRPADPPQPSQPSEDEPYKDSDHGHA